MESPVVLDKPPEYGSNNERGFPFDEEDASGAWSQLAARHPDIAARLRARPQTWQRKRRPSGHDADDFADDFTGFDRFPFDDIPAEFREHFPQHFTRREHPPPPPPPAPPQQHTSSTQTSSTQTEQPGTSNLDPQANLPQYGLRNTVDLGQKSPVDPSVDAEDRSQRSASAPPESRNAHNMSQPPQPEPHQPAEAHSNVRHIPIFVEGRDEPVINRTTDHGAHYAEPKPTHAPPPPHVDRDQYFSDDIPVGFNHPQNFSRAFGTPFHKGFRQGPQPFVQQKVYPQTAFARANSPHRSQSPKPQQHQEEFVKVPVHHENKPEPPRAAPKPTQPPKAPQQQQQQQHQQQHQQQQPPQQQQAPPKPTPSPNDPITQILAVQTDVLNLMTEVENFTGSKKDKRYMFLDEMLTRNLIKLDTIETDGKENIRQARKEAIKCIQKCIAVLEAKAEKGSQALEVEMQENQSGAAKEAEAAPTNESKPAPANENQPAPVENGEQTKEETQEQKADVEQPSQPQAEDEKKEEQTPQAADTRPEEPKEADGDKKASAKKKVVKKRGKSKENQPAQTENSTEAMQVDDKGDKSNPNSQTMDVDGAAASQ